MKEATVKRTRSQFILQIGAQELGFRNGKELVSYVNAFAVKITNPRELVYKFRAQLLY